MKIKSLLIGLATFFISVVGAQQVFAGTDLTVSCPNFGVCSISPSGTPLFDEAGWMPGSTVTQRLSVTNTSGNSGFVAVEVLNYVETKNLGSVVDVEIRRGTPSGPVVYGNVTAQEFRDDGYFTIDGISASTTTDYYLTATMSAAAGNEFQAAMLEFDLKVGLEVAPIPPTSGGGNGSGGSGGGNGGTSPASPPVCNDTAPSSAPSLSITSVGTNTVSLSWTSVSPVTHYALVFTRNSDGEAYGSPNIGNTTNYTVTNLSGGAGYSFEVFGVNGCQPGPRSSKISSSIIPGPFIGGRPTGGDGQVLGETTETATPSASPAPTPSPKPGDVLGADDVCRDWKQYIPWILLVAQAAAVLASEYWLRRDRKMTKHYLAIGWTLLSIFIFYLIRQCGCYAQASFLTWLCKWYWVVALILTLLLKAISYAFIEEVDEEEKKKKVEQLEKAE